MPAQQSSKQKICTLCHQDCSDRPRIKDPKGRYYCRECYENAKQQKRSETPAPTRAPAPPRAPAPLAAPLDDGDDLGLLVNLAAEAATAPREEQPSSHCPSCNKAMPPQATMCVECGYNRSVGQHVTPAVVQGAVAAAPARGGRTGGGIGVPEALTQPWILFVAPVAVFGILFLLGRSNDAILGVYAILVILFCVAVGLWALVAAFRESVGTGLLTMFLPFYVFYFVFAKNDDPYLKSAYGAAMLSYVTIMIPA